LQFKATCKYACLDSIQSLYTQKMVEANGNSALTLECAKTFKKLVNTEFGVKGDMEGPSEGNTDTLAVVPPSSPGAVAAADAVLEHINDARATECAGMAALANATVLYAKRGESSGGRGEYRLELGVGSADGERLLYTARVAHLPLDREVADPEKAGADPENLLGRYAVMRLSPAPCAAGKEAQLAVTETSVRALNVQQLSWRAALRPHHEGRTHADYGLGYKDLSPSEMRARKVVLATAGVELPRAFDARDHRDSVEECRAFEPLDQGSCGSCYAFAAATSYSARMCRKTSALWNIVASPQEMLDCTGGCDGGNPLTVFERIVGDRGYAVENWCDPYTEVRSECGGTCGNGNKFRALANSARSVGDASEDGVKQMQMELMMHGPGAVTFMVYDDLMSYSEGIYTVSPGAKATGLHAVTLIGWGEEDLDGESVPYWLVQNSWGKQAGEGGFYRIRRGTNEAGIEERGILVVEPELPLVCAEVDCLNKGTVLADCSCRCQGGWTGALCGTCELTCQNGGVPAEDCSKCHCPDGFTGEDCADGAQLEPNTVCEGDAEPAVLTYSFPEAANAPTQKSFAGIYALGESRTFEFVKMAYVCGDAYDASVNGGRCPESGRIELGDIPAAGEYKVVINQFLPPNSGYYVEMPATKGVMRLSVLAAGCSDELRAATAEDNSPAARLQLRLEAEAVTEAEERAAENARLDIVDRLLGEEGNATESGAGGSREPGQALEQKVELPALRVMSARHLEAGETPLWMAGRPDKVCFSVPPSANVNPKWLVVYGGDGTTGSYYATGLNGAGPNLPLPAEADGCIDVELSPGLPDGAYTLKLQQEWNLLFSSIEFDKIAANVAWTGFSSSADTLTLSLRWGISGAAAAPGDIVKIKNAAGSVVHWFYTSCLCADAPGEEAVPEGAAVVKLGRANSVPGGYSLWFYRDGRDQPAAMATRTIDFASLGW